MGLLLAGATVLSGIACIIESSSLSLGVFDLECKRTAPTNTPDRVFSATAKATSLLKPQTGSTGDPEAIPGHCRGTLAISAPIATLPP
jgi:hypothetical protein